MELRIEGRLGDGYRVVGGLEPHRVLQRGAKWMCDCADRAKGNLCKHILAVRLMQKDSELIRFGEEFKNDKLENTIDLFELWFWIGNTEEEKVKRMKELVTKRGTIRFPAYIPVTTYGNKYPLDNLIRPYLPLLAQAMMVSWHYAQQIDSDIPLPLFLDSGGFACLFDGPRLKNAVRFMS